MTFVTGNMQEDKEIYKLVDIHGGGELVTWLRYGLKNGDQSFFDGIIDSKLPGLMYNNGQGKSFVVAELLKVERAISARSYASVRIIKKKNEVDFVPNKIPIDGAMKHGITKKGEKQPLPESNCRELTWRLDERGSMGETIIGICLLQSTDIHNRIAIKILDVYPKLVNDINVSEEYYGLTPLHQAIINQDVRMVYQLLKRGADVNARCCGVFFTADDQKEARRYSMKSEFAILPRNTNYKGSMYFGEYPLSFAASMNQHEIYRILLAKNANPNAQDRNGNSVLHMCVIHDNMEMFRIAIQNGASLRTTNHRNLTPLTLAAKMGKKTMYMEILEIEANHVWAYGDATSTAYPLAKIDTINESTGELNENSALSMVVYGESPEHLDLLDELLNKIIEQKWKAYGKSGILRSLAAFTLHWMTVVVAYFLRPVLTDGWIYHNDTLSLQPYQSNTSPIVDGKPWDINNMQCHLLFNKTVDEQLQWVRLILEPIAVISVLIQMYLDLKDIQQIGWKKWWAILRTFPAKLVYKCSFFCVVIMVPIRVSCSINAIMLDVDNILSTIIVFLTSVHFLFYCRAVPFVGPFVLMIYRIITTDIRRFLLIYSIFLVGFSHSFFFVFLGCDNAKRRINGFNASSTEYLEFDKDIREKAQRFNNVLENPVEAFIRTFIMTIGEFTTLYRNLAMCPNAKMRNTGKILFLLFEMGVSVLQFNLLIAMMTRTYETIFRTKMEYKRQFARVILLLELSLKKDARLLYLLKYSRPTGTNRKARSLVVNKKNIHLSENGDLVRKGREKSEKLTEEKRMLMKRKIKDMQEREARPATAELK